MNRASPEYPASQFAGNPWQPPSSSQASAALVEAIATKALPWIENFSDERMVIARPTLKEMKAARRRLPRDLELSSRPLQGRRVIVRERPTGFQFVSARWPADGLETKRFPMIACILNGPAELRVGDYILSCKEGHFVLLPAGVPHPDSSRVHLEGENQNRRSCTILWFCPLGEVLRCWICHSHNGKHGSAGALFLTHKKLVGYCDLLFDETSDEGTIHRKIRQGLMITLLSSVQNEIEHDRFFRWLPQSLVLSSEEVADPIKRAQNYIRQNLSEPLTLARLARYCYMSRSQFANKFRHETGQTFVEFLNCCRLEEAKMRLATSSAQIAGLSRHVGLKPRHFSKIFQQHTGLTPGAYRRQHNPHYQAPCEP